MSKQRSLEPAALLEAEHWPEEERWERSGSIVTLHGRVPRDLFHLTGHFPGNPLVPGFVAVSWALGTLERALQRSIHVKAMHRLKFLRALRPGDAFKLRIELGTCSSGQSSLIQASLGQASSGQSSSGQWQAAFSFLEDAAAPAPLQEVPYCSGVLVYDEGSGGDN